MATYDLASSIPDSSVIKGGDILNCSYSGTYKTVTLPQGTYKLECWGAQGGSYDTTYTGGKGGYSYGTLTLTGNTILYLYTGGQGTGSKPSGTTLLAGGFNGGGQGLSGSGGGASDVRIGQNSLYARVIVAGGGGGAGYYSNQYYGNGGAGGGTSGVAGQYKGAANTTTAGQGGTATAGGAAGTGATTKGSAGTFGIGGNSHARSSYGGGAGGGGWYGGGGASNNGEDGEGGGGGGSGYVYTSSTASQYPSGGTLNSNYYLTSASTSAGQRAGDGYITITASSTANDWAYTTSSISAPTYNKQTTSSITLTQNACKCYSFTPTFSGPFIVYGTGTADNYGYLCSSAPTLNTSGQPTSYLISNDDNASLYNGGTSNASFGFMYNVTAGTTYYLYIKPYSNTTSSQTITVTYWMGHPGARMFVKINNTTWKQITS